MQYIAYNCQDMRLFRQREGVRSFRVFLDHFLGFFPFLTSQNTEKHVREYQSTAMHDTSDAIWRGSCPKLIVREPQDIKNQLQLI